MDLHYVHALKTQSTAGQVFIRSGRAQDKGCNSVYEQTERWRNAETHIKGRGIMSYEALVEAAHYSRLFLAQRGQWNWAR